MKIYLIGLPARRRPAPTVEEAASASPLFRHSVAFARAQGGGVIYALHARAGLLRMSDPLPDPDVPSALVHLSKLGRDGWGRSIAAALASQYATRRMSVVILAPRAAVEVIAPYVYASEAPLARMGIGEQLAWLARHTTASKP